MKKNEVFVLGTIHGGHLKHESYNLKVLADIIRKYNPEIILSEIPPDRFPIAQKEFLETDSISEPRVAVFPEYVDVVFPLSKTMNFEIIPTAAWTKEMANLRSQKLKEISNDSTRAAEWNQLLEASKKAESLLDASGKRYDPFWIHSAEYDKIVDIELSVYNKLFNEELGKGGWDNINKAHYKLIAKALDDYKFQGKRILICFGAGHKAWFLNALEKRDDIVLKSIQEAIL